MDSKLRENIGWIDVLRILACFLVVLAHSCDAFVAQFDADRTSFLSGVFWGSLVRPCVPLFVMMTGVLLFPIRSEMGTFYKKRIKRILTPLIFWSLVLPLLFFGYLNYVNTTQNPAIALENFTWDATIHKMYTFIFNFNYDTTPLWYLYMLIGLYLIMPVLGAWLDRASQREMRLFLFAWGLSLLLPYINMAAPLLGYSGNYGNMGLYGVCDWNSYGTFYYVAGFIGYLVLAHYLVKYPLDWSWKKMLAVTVPMFLAGYAVTSLGFIITQEYFPGNYAYLEIIWYYAGINVFLMTFPVFVIVQKCRVASSPVLSRIASLTFGIYLCHFVIIQVAYDWWITFASLPPAVKIIAIACTTFGITYGVVWVMAQFKLTRRFIM